MDGTECEGRLAFGSRCRKSGVGNAEAVVRDAREREKERDEKREPSLQLESTIVFHDSLGALEGVCETVAGETKGSGSERGER
jgi:hypothetical protein